MNSQDSLADRRMRAGSVKTQFRYGMLVIGFNLTVKEIER